MDSKNTDFRNLYFKNIQPLAREFDVKREKLIKNIFGMVFGVIVGATPFALHVVYFKKFQPNIAQGVVITLAIAIFAACLFEFLNVYGEYKKSYKEKVIAVVFKAIAPELEYKPEGCLPQAVFDRSLLIPYDLDRFSGDDYFGGKIKGIFTEFSEVLAECKQEYKDSKGYSHERWVTVFKGIFFSADFNKEIRGKTFVYPDQLEKWLGNFGKVIQEYKIKKPAEFLVKLEDPRFEKEFIVYSSNQIEARYCLSPQVMEGLLTLKNLLKRPFSVSFYGTRINIAIPVSFNQFEPPIFKSTISYSQVLELWTLLSALTSIVDLVDLNTRIWTKV